jgi:hypothetical protein
MHIILKKIKEQTDILNVFYGNDTTLINNWIKEYINDDIEKFKLEPLNKDVRSISYEIIENQTNFELIKQIKRINKGYVYNSSERLTENVYTITVIEYTNTIDNCNLKENTKWADINNEINNRVLKQLDKESLYQVLTKIQTSIKVKSNWNYTEYTSLVSEILKTFKKDLYSSIAKRLKRFGKKQYNYSKINFSTEQLSGTSCKIESLKHKIE